MHIIAYPLNKTLLVFFLVKSNPKSLILSCRDMLGTLYPFLVTCTDPEDSRYVFTRVNIHLKAQGGMGAGTEGRFEPMEKVLCTLCSMPLLQIAAA